SPPSIAEYLHPRKFEEPSRRGNIASILLTVEPQEADRGEPSWSALGAMIQEYSYLFGYYELNLRRNIWSVDTSRAMEEVRIAAKGHPLLNFLESFNLKRSQMDKYSDLLDRIAVVDADVQMMPMIRVMRYAQLARKAPSVFMDSIAGDLEQGLNKMGLPLNTQVKLAKVLRHVSPYSPAAYATLIENDWTNSEPQIADWDREHGHQFEVAAALARRYLATGRTEEAKSKLERLISVSKDKWAFTELARIHKASGNVDEWKAVLDEYLKKGADSGLQKTSVRVELANHYMGRGEYEKAEPYAGEAAKSWAAWAMLTATKCYEKLGRWNDAELWIRRTSERYQESQLIWFFWCKRTGHGDAFAASKLGDKMIKRLEKEGRADYVSHRTAAFYLMSDRPDEALKFYLRLHKAGDGLAGIFAALLSEELELPATRDDAFLLAQLARGKDPLVAGLASLVTEIETGGLVTGLPIEKLKRLIDSKRRAEALGKLPCRQAARRARLS
ncbi:MAG: hypothetical protein QF886_06955, partial [Planctomycetota bacterium]|nr:hypothetical protein [Planctomycetota bacterium]